MWQKLCDRHKTCGNQALKCDRHKTRGNLALAIVIKHVATLVKCDRHKTLATKRSS
jgi:hypothetical protein